jgi:hypothetical protein
MRSAGASPNIAMRSLPPRKGASSTLSIPLWRGFTRATPQSPPGTISSQSAICTSPASGIPSCETSLLEPKRHSRVTYEITGPDLLSFKDIAGLFSRAYNVPIDYEVITPEELYATFDALGVPRGYTEDAPNPLVPYGSDEVVTAYIAFDQGYHAILSHHVEFITGKRPVPLREVIAKAKLA